MIFTEQVHWSHDNHRVSRLVTLEIQLDHRASRLDMSQSHNKWFGDMIFTEQVHWSHDNHRAITLVTLEIQLDHRASRLDM